MRLGWLDVQAGHLGIMLKAGDLADVLTGTAAAGQG